MRSPALILGLVLLSVGSVRAHDPYEITAVVYVRSNVIELFVEMEFPAGMTLAGLSPTRDVAAETQFEAGLPQLKNLAGGLFEITAGNNVVQPLSTNMELGVELHIRGRVEFALTDYRPLRFVPRELKAVPDVPYGISLTVLDMVNQKVLGQSALFADSPPAEFPAAASTTTPIAQPTLAVRKPSEPPAIAAETNTPSATNNVGARGRARWPTAALLIGSVVAILVAWQRSNSRG
ncbi:MAG TPA: hypothetical protein VFZ59_00570 [Verrucomicrobiae bacterium]|nr:hypothetical protein [Verrucomicrobiae bacterium]